ncbi:hypothetical protein HN604_00020 [archaeon]|jgi:hypothetical protein|nr:hypothetical protein [archaeon]MBT6183001.1 hypothetical protein [archaeon]MBT6606047.1 hypothetical protein [archaeon]MBT7251690.1 hypothetical protein [archaeon]MBT7660450.1 hypothetical protein [archaeon]
MEKINSPKIYLLISIIGVLMLLFIAQNFQEKRTGIIEGVKYSNNKISITLENENATLTIFGNKILSLKSGDEIIYEGKPETYRGKEQFIVDKIVLLK